ncbi:DUF4296 domain-containing protein [Tenacibaculum jejuense]|uniref:DUF4296 domain-containing protein n=1 Tax=Tenacibaculum jejuense TaxID=584609 RepID=A0A238U6D7_9FLAO|nr:DUF4296 domain-containing protein [Tenacibaculum jejuense]SNR14054.1 conserved exported protein of unknown function [Tenacibaculum jejuense]
MKNIILFILCISLCLACTGNTIYKEPKNLIPRDSMVALLTDMHIAAAAKPVKNLDQKRDLNYMQLVYDKYKIDSLRFEQSNIYYTSKIDEYDKLLKDIRRNIEVIASTHQLEKNKRDSIKKSKAKRLDSINAKKIKAKKDSLIVPSEEEDE